MKTRPPSTLLRLPELKAAVLKFQPSSFLRQRLIALLEFALFDGYWPTSLSDIDVQKVFLVTAFHEEYLKSVSAALGFPEGFALELRREVENLWKDLCPEELRLSCRESAAWPLTAAARCFTAPFLEPRMRLLAHPGGRPDPRALVDSALASIGVGVVEALAGEAGNPIGALGAGGVLLDEENPHSWEFFVSLPFESQAWVVAKFRIFLTRVLGDALQPHLRNEMGDRIHGLIETIRVQVPEASDPLLARKRQASVALLGDLEKFLRP